MSRPAFLAAVLILFFTFTPLNAADYEPDQIPEGMELIEIGQTKVLVPVGSRVEKKGGLVMLENVGDYVARNISSLESRVVSLEMRMQRLEIKIEKLTDRIARLTDKSLTSSEKDD